MLNVSSKKTISCE